MCAPAPRAHSLVHIISITPRVVRLHLVCLSAHSSGVEERAGIHIAIYILSRNGIHILQPYILIHILTHNYSDPNSNQ